MVDNEDASPFKKRARVEPPEGADSSPLQSTVANEVEEAEETPPDLPDDPMKTARDYDHSNDSSDSIAIIENPDLNKSAICPSSLPRRGSPDMGEMFTMEDEASKPSSSVRQVPPSTNNQSSAVNRKVPQKPVREGNKLHILIGVTGSVATIKLSELVQELFAECGTNKIAIKVVATHAAKHFMCDQTLTVDVYEDADEWTMWQKRDDPVLHIELRKWADVMLLAPLDANSLAKIANGLCDNLLTSVVRAWDQKKALYFAPAMNTMMWDSPHTVRHRKTLKELLNFKALICGDEGMGAMANVKTIVSVLAMDVKRKFSVYTTGY